MGRRPRGERVYGPYPHRGRWRVILTRPAGGRGGGSSAREETPYYFGTEAEARRFAERARAELDTPAPAALTVEDALERYERFLRDGKGNKPGSIARTMWSLRRFFGAELGEPLAMLTERRCKALYEALTAELAVDSHRNALAETKTWARWAVAERLLARSPLEHVQGMGRRSKGKPQLRFREARLWRDRALALAEAGDDGAVAAMLCLILGLRASEVTHLRARDVDELEERADLLWVEDSKTPAGRRRVEVPELLRPHLVRLVEGKGPTAWLFATRRKDGSQQQHWRDWPREQVQRICRLAGVPEVCAHSMRGLHATIAMERGTTGAIVAAALGHEDERTTKTAYAESEAIADGVRRRALKVLDGGKKGA